MRLRSALVTWLLVDVAVLSVVAALGIAYGFRDVVGAYLDWREEHLWTFLATPVAIAALIVYRRRARPA